MCGCSKKKKKQPIQPPQAPFMPMNRVAGLADGNSVVKARCPNCVGLLRTSDGRYLPMNTGDFFEVTQTDVARWRVQGWAIEVQV